MSTIFPLSGRGKEITYSLSESNWIVKWSRTKFTIEESCIQKILDEFFIDKEVWYPLGASMDCPIQDGLGCYLKNNYKSYSSRHASAIAAILVNENKLTFKGNKPIYLKKI